MLSSVTRSMVIFALLSALTLLAYACHQDDYGINKEDKCQSWWEEASKVGSTNTVLCVDLIMRNCPQMLDMRVSSQSKWPSETYVSVVTEFLATNKRTAKTISFNDKTTQQLCWEEDKDCSLLWRTYISDIVPQSKKDECWRLLNKFCTQSRGEETAAIPFGSRPFGSQNRMYSDPSYADLGTRVSSSSKEYKESNVKTEFSQKSEKLSGTDYSSKYGSPGSYSYDKTDFKHEHSSHEYKETTNTYHKQNPFTLDTSPGSPAAETGLHPVLASLGGTATTVTEIEDTQRKTATENSLMKIRAESGPRDEIDGRKSRFETEEDVRKGLRAETDSRVGLRSRAATETDSRTGIPNRSTRAQDPEAIEKKLPSGDYAPIRSIQDQNNPSKRFDIGTREFVETPKPSPDSINALHPQETVYKQEKSFGENKEYEHQEYSKNEWVPSPYSRGGQYLSPARGSNNVNGDYRVPSRSFEPSREEQCDIWWQSALQQYQKGINPVDMVDRISQNCPSLLQISSQPIKTVFDDHVNIEILKTVTNLVTRQTIQTSLTRIEALCSDQDVDCDLYWRIIYRVGIPDNVKQICIDLVYQRCPKDHYVSSDGRSYSNSVSPKHVGDNLRNRRNQ